MNKLLVVSAVILNLLLVNQISYADPGHGHKREYRDREARSNFQGNEDDDNLQEKHRLREERGLRRLQQHHQRLFESCYTASRLPVQLCFSCEYATRVEALAAERQIKGWSRSKKEALFRSDWSTLQKLSQNHQD